MKTKSIKIALQAFFIIGIVIAGYGQVPYIAKQVKMTVSGSSTLHEWESEVTKVEWSGSLKMNANVLTEVKDVVVKIPVVSIKSTKGKIMDNKTYEAFNYEKFPTIQYKLINAKISGTGADYTITAIGNLSMAGATKQIDLIVKAKVQPNGEVILTSAKKLNMKEFSMETPTAMMGAIKVGEEVTIAFQITLNTTNNTNL